MQFTKLALASILSGLTSAQIYENGTVITTNVIVTNYVTYCPNPTTIELTVCPTEEPCKATEIVVTEATHLTVEEPCLIESTITKDITITQTVTCSECAHTDAEETETIETEAPIPSSSIIASIPVPQNVSEYEGAAVQNVAGVAAGFVAIAAALL
ncbi:uncharacterized protein KGF55_004680 [Candida pseudojiufengensis]|uniref:uncharacterized protein n=1 Tax=Candida pseudojiufengensis TaxID=497109 RepID=UPI002225265B|nr:uncharacterized protein KGF55_004680 [Candida pseudojiufengensis]KAI5960388.1 hypothetical protein KGF55_004680 [Candida pseudojiufengensis]